MTEFAGLQQIALPIGLGLFGFVEPCSIGSTLVFVKTLEGRERAAKILQVTVFTLVRGLFMGLLGLAAAAIGMVLFGAQKIAWIGFGLIYVALGAVYLVGKSASLLRAFGGGLLRLSDVRGSVALGIVFAFNIPACATPLLLALLGFTAAGTVAPSSGFLSLTLFGFALSLPLVLAVLFAPARRALDALGGLSRRLPFWTGVVLIALGLWSIWFGLFVPVGPAA